MTSSGPDTGPTLFGYAIDSELELPRARRGPNGRGRLMIRCSDDDLLAREGELVSWDDRDGIQFGLATSGPDLLAWCSITGSYVVRGDGSTIVTRRAGVREHWEHRLGATIVPLALAEWGDLALHAAALLDGDRAVLVCGPPGRGKSTTAAALTLRGVEVLSEDGVVISFEAGRPLTWPGQDGVRIPLGVLAALEGGSERPLDALEKTTQLQRGLAAAGPVQIEAVILLRPPGGVRPELERVDAVAALPALMPHALYGGPTRLKETLERTAAVVARVPVFRARIPRDLRHVGEHAESLLRRAR